MHQSPAVSIQDEGPPGAAKRSALGIFLAAFGLALGVALCAVRWLHLGPVDDAFISLRYAFNWAHGNGLVYNPGERVEGYTNFLLVALESAAIRLGADPVQAMLWIGRLALAGTAGLTACFARRIVRSWWLAVLVGGLLVLQPGMLAWGTSGLETTLHALLLLAALLVALEARGATRTLAAAGLLVLAAMTRPETVIVVPALLLAVRGQDRSLRRPVLFAAAFVLGFGAYFAARAIHFGALFPNTFYAKLDYGGGMILRRGALYVWDFIRGNPLLVGLAAALSFMGRLGTPVPRWARVLAAVCGLWTLGVIYEGGDHFPLFRFLIPVLPLLVLLAVQTVVVAAPRLVPRMQPRTAWCCGFAAIALSGLIVLPQHKRDEMAHATQLDRYRGECDLTRQWEVVGVWLRSFVPPGIPVCTIAIGAVGYRSGLTIVDPYGLVDPKIAHLHRRLGAGYAGHEKYDVDAVLRKRPGYILIVHYPTPKPVPLENLPGFVWGGFYHDLVRSPRLFRDYVYRTFPLGPWTMNVMVRRDLDHPAGGTAP